MASSLLRLVGAIVASIVVFGLGPVGSADATATPQLGTPITPDRFGVDINPHSGEMPTFEVGSVRFWDDATRWSLVEPQKNVFDWTNLDQLVDGAAAGGRSILYTMGQTPLWAVGSGAPPCTYGGCSTAPPTDMADWDDYVRAVVTRYKGKIGAYEIWNEPTTTTFYSGTVAQMVTLAQHAYNIIKEVDPQAIVASPSGSMIFRPNVQQWMDQFAAAGGYNYCDVVAIHPYVTDQPNTADHFPEDMNSLVSTARSILSRYSISKPLWDTEDSPYSKWTLNQTDADAWMARYFLVEMYNGFDRSYFYAWGLGNPSIGLQTPGQPPSPAALAMQQLEGWMHGATLMGCAQNSEESLPANAWQCTFHLPSTTPGYTDKALVRWSTSGTQTLVTPPGAYETERIDSAPQAATPGQSVQVNGLPLIVRYRTKDGPAGDPAFCDADDRFIANENVEAPGGGTHVWGDLCEDHITHGYYWGIVVQDDKGDGKCAHAVADWAHKNGNRYDDTGMWLCGYEKVAEFAPGPRNPTLYLTTRLGASVDGGATAYGGSIAVS